DGSTPLHIVAKKGYADCVRMIIQQGANVNAPHRQLGHSALHYAAMAGSYKSMNHLLNAGAN
ncbi:ankyrin repeat-containing domain protein, partial [Ochromonadaceae sp. CCMP2298]